MQIFHSLLLTNISKIKRILSTDGFHGTLSEKMAVHKLKQPLDYLVRFSGKPGNFSISYVSSSNSVVHRRIKYSNTKFIFNNQAFYSLQVLLDAFKKQKYFAVPVQSSQFAHLFKSAASSGYVMDDNEAEFMEED